MELKLIKCPRCGGELTFNNGYYYCNSCMAKFIENTAIKNQELLGNLIDNIKQEKVATLRQNLWKSSHEEYLSKRDILEVARSIKTYLPDDLLANFYESACSNNRNDIIEFLSNFNIEENYGYVDLITEFMIKNLTEENLLAVNNLIENAYKDTDLKLYNKYTSELSKEAEKVKKGVYILNSPRDVFIAYSSKDMKIVEELTKFLEAQGFSCFVAMRNLKHGLGAVENYDKALEEAIENCKIFLLISTKQSRAFSCDATKKEIPFVKKLDRNNAPAEYRNIYDKMPRKYKKPRIELLIEKHSSDESTSSIIKEFFNGYEWCYDYNSIAERIVKILSDDDLYEDIEETTQNNIKNTEPTNTNNSEIEELKRQLEELKRAQEEKKRIEEENKEKERLKQELEALKKAEELERIRKEQELERLKKEQEQKAQKKYKREGDYIYFGSYPQGENGEIEPIKWRILSEENGEALLLSEYILDAHRFDEESNNYENSEIRKWLNNDFYNKAFNENEKQIILTTEVDNSERSTNPNRNANEFNKGKNKHACENTQDKVFLLSMQEATNPKYGFDESDNSHKSREKKPTAYAIKQGAWYEDEEGCETYGNGIWWLRSPDYDYYDIAWYVRSDGYVDYYSVYRTTRGVAGALKIKL